MTTCGSEDMRGGLLGCFNRVSAHRRPSVGTVLAHGITRHAYPLRQIPPRSNARSSTQIGWEVIFSRSMPACSAALDMTFSNFAMRGNRQSERERAGQCGTTTRAQELPYRRTWALRRTASVSEASGDGTRCPSMAYCASLPGDMS